MSEKQLTENAMSAAWLVMIYLYDNHIAESHPKKLKPLWKLSLKYYRKALFSRKYRTRKKYRSKLVNLYDDAKKLYEIK